MVPIIKTMALKGPSRKYWSEGDHKFKPKRKIPVIIKEAKPVINKLEFIKSLLLGPAEGRIRTIALSHPNKARELNRTMIEIVADPSPTSAAR